MCKIACRNSDNFDRQGVTLICQVCMFIKAVDILEMLLTFNEQKNILHEITKRKANWIGHIVRRNCLLKQVIEGKIKGQIEVK